MCNSFVSCCDGVSDCHRRDDRSQGCVSSHLSSYTIPAVEDWVLAAPSSVLLRVPAQMSGFACAPSVVVSFSCVFASCPVTVAQLLDVDLLVQFYILVAPSLPLTAFDAFEDCLADCVPVFIHER